MKKSMLFLMTGLFIIAGCSKDDSSSGPSSDDQKKVQVTRNMTVTLSSIPDFSLPHVECIPDNSNIFLCGGGALQGTVSEVDAVVTGESTWITDNCELVAGENTVKHYISGKITSVSGDYLTFTGIISIDLSDYYLQGTLFINGGTGKFHKSSGTVNVEGEVTQATSCFTWTGTGTITLWM